MTTPEDSITSMEPQDGDSPLVFSTKRERRRSTTAHNPILNRRRADYSILQEPLTIRHRHQRLE
jgi:hypothetical protein